MGVFDFFKRKVAKPKDPSSSILLAMPMFKEGDSFELSEVVAHLKGFWESEVSDVSGDKQSAVFSIDNVRVALAFMDIPIPWGDIESTAQYAYNWRKAEEELKDHTGHAIVTVLEGDQSAFEKNRVMSKLICSVLATSKAVGIYKGTQTLLIPRDQYLSFIDLIKEGSAPVPIWVYVGLRTLPSGNSAYTYGLNNFGKREMEIIDSSSSLEELYGLLMNISAYVIERNIEFNDGETIGETEEQKIKLKKTKGRLVEGEVFRLIE